MPKKTNISPRKQPRQERSRATVEAILRATARVLIEGGYDSLTTNRVAVVAGVSVGSLYQYFPSKEALVAALVDRHLESIMSVVTEKLATAGTLPLTEGARLLIGALVEAHRIDPRLHQVLVEQLPRVGGLEKIREFDSLFVSLAAAAFARRQAELGAKDPQLTAFILVNAVKGVVFAASTDPERLEGDAIIDELVTLITGYLSSDADS